MDIVTYGLLSNSKNIKVTDTNNYFTSDNVEGVLSEVGLEIDELANSFIHDFQAVAGIPYHTSGALSSGTVSQIVTPDTTHFGIVRYSSSTSANSGYYFMHVSYPYRSNVIGLKQVGVFRTLSTLNTIIARIGWSGGADFNIIGERPYGIYLFLDGSGVLSGRHADNSVMSETTTNYTLQANTFYRYQIEVLSNTQIKFTLYQDNTDVVLWTEILVVSAVTSGATRDGHHVYSSGTSAIALLDFDYVRVYTPNQRKVW